MNNQKMKILVLAAGKGTRMLSELPKVLINFENKPLVKYVLESIHKSGIDTKPTIVIGYKKELVREQLGENYDYVVQDEQLGTGHAVMCAYEKLKDDTENLIVLPSDHPFITSETIRKLAKKHLNSDAKITMATIKLPSFEYWGPFFYKSFSRIIRNKNEEIVKDVQFKDATEEEKKVTEVNPIYFCFNTTWLWENIKNLKTNNAQKEYYLTDLIKIGIDQGIKIETIEIEPKEGLAANSKEELEILKNMLEA